MVLDEMIRLFFKRNTNVRSGAKEFSSARELAHQIHELNEIWYSEFPGYCRESAVTWTSWYGLLENKKHNKLTNFEKSVIASVKQERSLSYADLEVNKLERLFIAKQYYSRKLAVNRVNAQGLSICNSREDPEQLKLRNQLALEKRMEELRAIDLIRTDLQADDEPDIATSGHCSNFDDTNVGIRVPGHRFFGHESSLWK